MHNSSYVMRTIKMLFTEAPLRMVVCVGLLIVAATFAPLSMVMINYIIKILCDGEVVKVIPIIAGYSAILFLNNALPLINILGSYLWITAEIVLQKAIINKIDTLSAEYFDCEKYYSSLRLARESYGRAIGTTMMLVSALCLSALSLGMITTYLSTISWIVPIVLTVILLGKILIYNLIGIQTHQMQAAMSEEFKDCDLLSTYLCSKDSIVFGAQHYFLHKWEKVADSLRKEQQRCERKNIILLGCFDLFAYCTYILMIFIITINQLYSNSIAINEIIMLILATDIIYTNLDNVIAQIGNVYKSRNLSKGLFDFLDCSTDTTVSHSMVDGDQLILNQVCFKYPGSDSMALQDINLCIHQGETVAVVGRNGSGKSTFVKVLAGLYSPTQGYVTYGNCFGLNADTMEQMTAVFQDFNTYNISIKDNILIGDMENTVSSPLETLRSIAVGDWIDKLPEGIETHLGVEFGGIQLSGGEAQQLAIARAFFRRHAITFLDEPTSAIDPILEDALYKAFYKNTRGSTAIIVTHRLASTQFADRIIVFDKGRIVEEGTHRMLMKKKGLYYHLYSLQREYYQR